MMVFKRGGW